MYNPNSPYSFARSQSNTLNSPYASASDISLPLTTGTGTTNPFLGQGELTASPTSSGSSSVRYVYAKGRATPAPPHHSTVKLVTRHSQMPSSSSSVGTATELPTHTVLDVPQAQGRELRFDEEMANEERERGAMEERSEREEHVGPDGVVPKQPKLAWPLTVGLLIIVTVVSTVYD